MWTCRNSTHPFCFIDIDEYFCIIYHADHIPYFLKFVLIWGMKSFPDLRLVFSYFAGFSIVFFSMLLSSLFGFWIFLSLLFVFWLLSWNPCYPLCAEFFEWKVFWEVFFCYFKWGCYLCGIASFFEFFSVRFAELPTRYFATVSAFH